MKTDFDTSHSDEDLNNSKIIEIKKEQTMKPVHSTSKSCLESAIDFLKRGFSMIPVGNDKKPKIQWKKYQNIRATKEEIKKWWEKNPESNLAIVTGRISNLTVIDCDSPKASEVISSMIPSDVKVPIVNSPHGGQHYYFAYRESISTSSNNSSHIDIRADGGYIVCPPSKIKVGKYIWAPDSNLNEISEIPLIPEQLVTFLKNMSGKKEGRNFSSGKRFTQGNRDDQIFHALLGLFKDGVAKEEAMRIGIKFARICEPPFPEDIVEDKVARIWDKVQRFNQKGLRLDEIRFSESNIEEIKWLLPDIIPLGMLSIIMGDPGVGKTSYALQIASKLSRGIPNGGVDPNSIMGSTLYVSSEGCLPQSLKPRAKAYGADESKLIFISAVRTATNQKIRFSTKYHLPILRDKISDDPDIKFVIIDPIASHIGRIDSRDQIQVREAMDCLSEFAEETGVAVLVLLHLNKSEKMDVIYRGSGSMQFIAAAKIAWGIFVDCQDQNGNRLFLYPIKSNISKQSCYAFRIEEATVATEKGDIKIGKVVEEGVVRGNIKDHLNPRGVSKTEEAELFLTGYLENGSKLCTEIVQAAKEQGINWNTLNAAKRILKIQSKKDGLSSGWTWSLPTDANTK